MKNADFSLVSIFLFNSIPIINIKISKTEYVEASTLSYVI